MKTMMSVTAFVATATFALATGSIIGAEKGNVLGKDPDGASDAFRSDSTLRFMRHLRHQNPVADAQQGPNYDSKKAQKAANNVLAKQPAQKVADPFHDAQQGPNYDSKKAQKASNNVIAKQQQQQPQEKADPVYDAQRGPNYDSKKAQKAADKIQKGEPKELDPFQRAMENAVESANKWKVPGSIQGGVEDGVKAGDAAGEGVADSSRKAKKGTNKVPDSIQEGVENGVKAGDAAGEGVADSARDAQKGPKHDSKEAQRAHKRVAAGLDDQADDVEKKASEKNGKEDAASEEAGCKNSPEGWADSKGNDCEDYAEGEFCNERGGYGDAWLDEWGKFEDVATKGKSALDVCCVCGGGHRDEEGEAEPKMPIAAAAAAPSPAGAPGPAGPILGSMKYRPLAEQGFHGDMVEHKDQETMTSDWGREFGPRAGHRDIKVICAEKPGNQWCSLHGYYDKKKSGASSKSMVAVLAALVFLSLQ